MALASQLLTPGHEPSIEELLNDPIAEAIMRYDRITREDVCRVISQVIARRVAARENVLETAGSSKGGRPTNQSRERAYIANGPEGSAPADLLA